MKDKFNKLLSVLREKATKQISYYWLDNIPPKLRQMLFDDEYITSSIYDVVDVYPTSTGKEMIVIEIYGRYLGIELVIVKGEKFQPINYYELIPEMTFKLKE